MKKKIQREIRNIVGSEHIETAAEDMLCYDYDGIEYGSLPAAVAHPASVPEVVALVNLARERKMPVVPRGAGTGLSGGALAPENGLIIRFDRMAEIKKIDVENRVAIAGPGVINWDLKQAARRSGLFYPPDPGSTRVCTLGGNVAENAGGPCGVKYGVTGDYVMGLEAVLPSGAVMRTGGMNRRDVAGYDLTSLLVGSEGTLAIVTEIIVRLLPLPTARRTSLFGFDSLRDAGKAIQAIGQLDVEPAALEIMDATTIECVEQYRSGQLPRGAAVILSEVDGETEAVEPQQARIVAACQEAGGRLERSAASEDEAEQIWEARRAISPALGRTAVSKLGEDISVPVAQVTVMIERLQQIGRAHDLRIAVFGHAGDGNLHPNILTDRNDPEMMRRTRVAVADIFAAALELGGTLSGEHGIGTTKAPFIESAVQDEALQKMRQIKELFDPTGVLNPGKIFNQTPWIGGVGVGSPYSSP